MCEPLRGKKINIDMNWKDGKEFDCFPFDDVKSAVEFYKKYKNTRFEFMTNYPKEYEKYLKSVGREHYKNNDVYNDWLFNYCFGDI